MSYLRQGYQPRRKGDGPTSNRNKQGGASRRPAKGSRGARRGPLRAVFLLALLACLATAGTFGYLIYDEIYRPLRENTFYPGVYVDDLPLSGAKPDEAAEYLYARASQAFVDWSVDLVYGENTWTVTAETIGVTDSLLANVYDEVNKAFWVGRRESSLLDSFFAIQRLKTAPYRAYTGDVQKSMDKVRAILQAIAETVHAKAQDATWTFDPSRVNPIVIEDEVYGREADLAALEALLAEKIHAMESGTIVVKPKAIAPAVTAELLRAQVVRLSNFSTHIDRRSTEDRTKNIERGCQSFHGMVVPPGRKVSFNDTVGRRTEKNGFFPAPEIVGGSYEDGIGGGICQVSSTLYNAVVQAGLKVESRTNHAIKVNYLDMGLDATVSDGRIDFVFRNNTEENIYLIARVDRQKRLCTFQIYGRPDPNGYTYALRADPPIEVKPMPEPVVVDASKPRMEGHPGYKVLRYLVTMDRHGNFLSETPLPADSYQPVAPRVHQRQ